MIRRQVGRAVARAGALLLVASQCSSGSGNANSSTLYALATHVDAARGAAGEFDPAKTGDHLLPGDGVRTDATGHAELDWADGSLTRLGPDTTLRISTLARPEKHRVTVRLDVGKTWSRVQRVTGSGGSDVQTPVAVASVRGTRFAVVCTAAPACTFTVVEGTVVLVTTAGVTISLTAGQSLTVRRGGTPDAPQHVSGDALNSDPFIAENLRLDALPRDRRRAVFS